MKFLIIIFFFCWIFYICLLFYFILLLFYLHDFFSPLNFSNIYTYIISRSGRWWPNGWSRWHLSKYTIAACRFESRYHQKVYMKKKKKSPSRLDCWRLINSQSEILKMIQETSSYNYLKDALCSTNGVVGKKKLISVRWGDLLWILFFSHSYFIIYNVFFLNSI